MRPARWEEEHVALAQRHGHEVRVLGLLLAPDEEPGVAVDRRRDLEGLDAVADADVNDDLVELVKVPEPKRVLKNLWATSG